MPLDLTNRLVVAISSRALFDLMREHQIFRDFGPKAYCEYERENRGRPIRPGAAFPLIHALLRLNGASTSNRRVEVVLMSKNSPSSSIRVFEAIQEFGLDVRFASVTGGASVAQYLPAYYVDLFLSADADDVREASMIGIASGFIYPSFHNSLVNVNEIRIALDGDSVVFSGESEEFYRAHGLEAFLYRESTLAHEPLPRGPFASFLKTVALLRQASHDRMAPIRLALVTARSMPAHLRVLNTLERWGIEFDEAHFVGPIDKTRILEVFRPHIFFDDDKGHCDRASSRVPTARVYAEHKAAIGVANS